MSTVIQFHRLKDYFPSSAFETFGKESVCIVILAIFHENILF